MIKRVVALIAAIVGVLLASLAPAVAIPDKPAATAPKFDLVHHSTPTASVATERGPPGAQELTPAYDYDAVDRWSHGRLARSVRAAGSALYTYDDTARLAQIAQATGTTHDRAQGAAEASSEFPPARVAANAGPRALPVGPWGQKIVEARTKLPSSWGPGTPNAKGVGTRWFDPANKGNGVRIDQGISGSSYASQQVDHVVVRSGGRILGPDGKPIVGPLSQNPQAHIPLSDWLRWSSWSTP